MYKQVLLSVLLLVVAVFITAKARATPISFTTRVLTEKQREVTLIHRWTERLQLGDHSVCVSYRATDMSGCAAQLVKQANVRSADGLKAMLDLVVAAAVKDRSLGFDEKQVSLRLADNFLNVAENLKAQTFFVRTERARNARDRVDQRTACQQEDKKLESFRIQALPSISEHLVKTDNISLYSDPKIPMLRQRLSKLLAKRWRC